MSIVPDCHKIAVVAITTRMNATTIDVVLSPNCRGLAGRHGRPRRFGVGEIIGRTFRRSESVQLTEFTLSPS
jgi:hypothetical protein